MSKPVTIVYGREPAKMGLLYRLGGEAPATDSTGDTLVMANYTTGVLEPMLAERWEQVAPDRWRFFLRKNVKFHTGEPFNASTAIYSIVEQTKSTSGSRIVRYAPNLTGEAVDETTLDIKCPAACPLLLSVSPQVQFAPPEWSKANPELAQKNPVGTGPYKFEEWRPGEFARYSVFPDYWGPKPSIPAIRFVWRGESTVRAAMIQTGEAHLGEVDITDEKSVPKFVSADSPDTTVIRLRARMDPKWEDVRLRKALAYAIDCPAIVKTLLAGKTQCRPMPFHPSTVGNPKNAQGYAYNPTTARQLLKEAGAEGLEFNFYGTIGSDSQEMLEAISGYWLAIGLKPKVSILEGAIRNQAHSPGVDKLPPHAMTLGHTNDIFDASVTVPYMNGCKEPRSYFRCDQAIVDRIAKASAASGAERQRLFEELMTQWNDEVVAIPLWAQTFTFGMSKDLEWRGPRFDGKIRVDHMNFTR